MQTHNTSYTHIITSNQIDLSASLIQKRKQHSNYFISLSTGGATDRHVDTIQKVQDIIKSHVSSTSGAALYFYTHPLKSKSWVIARWTSSTCECVCPLASLTSLLFWPHNSHIHRYGDLSDMRKGRCTSCARHVCTMCDTCAHQWRATRAPVVRNTDTTCAPFLGGQGDKTRWWPPLHAELLSRMSNVRQTRTQVRVRRDL